MTKRILKNAMVRAMIGSAAFALIASPAPTMAREGSTTSAPAGAVSYHGPKKTIAVAGFDAVGSFLSAYGGYDIGGGLSAMLASELEDSGRFVVVERAALDPVLREKEMVLTGVATGVSAAPIAGAQILVQGSVTEFDVESSGGGLNVGLNVGGILGGLGSRQSKSSVAIDLRLIDTGTGQIIGSRTVRKQLKSSQLVLRGSGRGISAGTNHFSKTPLGEAMRDAIAEAADLIVADTGQLSWRGMIASADGPSITVNAGENAGLAPGARLRAVRATRVITDPSTGEVLGSEERSIGDVVIERVEARYAIGRWEGYEPARRGDVLHFIEG